MIRRDTMLYMAVAATAAIASMVLVACESGQLIAPPTARRDATVPPTHELDSRETVPADCGLYDSVEALELERLLAEAEEHYEAGRWAEALAAYEETWCGRPSCPLPENITRRVADCYAHLGREIVGSETPQPERVPEAIDLFRDALMLDPTHRAAAREFHLAERYLDGYAAYQDGDWDEAAKRLRAVYDERPDYLGDITLNLLYDALINSGDGHREQGDRYMAFDLYRRAVDLPVEDNAWARARLLAVSICPPTPRPTPVPTPVPSSMLVVGEERAGVHSGPDTSYQRLGAIAAGARALIVGRFGEWWQIEHSGEVGWVFDGHVTVYCCRQEGCEHVLPTPTPIPRPDLRPGYTPLPRVSPVPCTGRSVRLMPPYVFIIDRRRVSGKGEWEGHLGILYRGGCTPYRYAINEGHPEYTNRLYFRWEVCRPMPLTVHVWSADGTEAHERMQMPGWCPEDDGR